MLLSKNEHSNEKAQKHWNRIHIRICIHDTYAYASIYIYNYTPIQYEFDSGTCLMGIILIHLMIYF